MLCAIAFPSRERPREAERAVESFRNTATTPESHRFLIRIDHDDPRKHEYEDTFLRRDDTSLIIGPREGGFDSGGEFFRHLCEMALDCTWVWSINDDMVIEGTQWDLKLDAIPHTGVIVQPEFHKLNASVYERDERSCAPCVPNGCWSQYGHKRIPAPLDAALPAMLKLYGWRTEFLPGITIFHDRQK